MNYLIALLVVYLLPNLLLGMTQKLEIGQGLEQAISALGKPIGTLELGSKTILLYPQGDVTLREGKVSDIDLMSDAAFAAVQERKRLEREEWTMQQEKLAAKRLEEGSKLKATKLRSTAFIALPAKKRVDYWRTFQIRYPKVDVSEQIANSLEDYQTELADQKNQERIAELEARVAQAERAAAEAEYTKIRLKDRLLDRKYAHYGRTNYYRNPYPVCYPQRKIIIRSNKGKTVRHPNHSRYKKYAYSNQRSGSTTERVSRILKARCETD